MSELLDPRDLPARFEDEAALEDFMTMPSQPLIDDLAGVDGDIIILGVGGKMGPTLARLAKRAAPDKRVVGVARFSEPDLPAALEQVGVETIRCDLLDREAVADLPKLANVVYMAGRKFGSSGGEELTWAMNVEVPAIVAEAFRDSRIVAFSTGNVYPLSPLSGMPATEDTPLAPVPGDYAYSCVGRERMFQYFSGRHGTAGAMIRLNYAIDTRYGVLYDIASKVWAGQPVDVTMGHVNVIWQGDANAQALRALRHCTSPYLALNVTGPETLSVRALAETFARRFDKPVQITGEEAADALLSNTSRAAELFGYPMVSVNPMIDWVADWVSQGQAALGKPTHFETRDGKY